MAVTGARTVSGSATGHVSAEEKMARGVVSTEAVRIVLTDAELPADLTLPADPPAVVLFAHGSGSSRHSPRNRAVAGTLARAGLATVLVDLLTEAEELVDELRFDIGLLAWRLVAIVDRLGAQPATRGLPVGLFGASTGAGAALVAAAERPAAVCAVVSRGGRPDLAGASLPKVYAPTLLIVGSRDPAVLDLNRTAAQRLGGPHHLEVVPGATHLFTEPGALERVAVLAIGWFATHLPGSDM
jgi:putative phosphoribosyl transferase